MDLITLRSVGATLLAMLGLTGASDWFDPVLDVAGASGDGPVRDGGNAAKNGVKAKVDSFQARSGEEVS